MNKQYYIGLDVHKNTIAIAYTHSGSRSEAIYWESYSNNNLTYERNYANSLKNSELHSRIYRYAMKLDLLALFSVATSLD